MRSMYAELISFRFMCSHGVEYDVRALQDVTYFQRSFTKLAWDNASPQVCAGGDTVRGASMFNEVYKAPKFSTGELCLA